MELDKERLEEKFENFRKFISKEDDKQFISFSSSELIDNNENYKYSVYDKSRVNLGVNLWSPSDIGTGKIKMAVESAINTKVNHSNQVTDNNLLYWRKKDAFIKRESSRSIEQLFFDLYKNKIKDQIAFERLVDEGLSYQFIAYLFFIKDSKRFLPISQAKFDKIFEYIGIQEFKTRNNASWENYIEYCNIIKTVRDFLRTKDENTTLLDAHSFLWILGWEIDDVKKNQSPRDHKLQKANWNVIIADTDVTLEKDLAILQTLYTFEDHQGPASKIGKALGNSPKSPHAEINLEIGRYAKRISKHYDIKFSKRANQEDKYWDLFFNGWADGDLFIWQLKPKIVQALENNNLTGLELPEEISTEDSKDLFEGAKKTITVISYERNNKARRLCLEHWGTKCAVCELDFGKVYGKIGEGFIHVHHLTPLSEIGESYEINPISDLIPVCPNCHSMIHLKTKKPRTIDEMKSRLNVDSNRLYQ